MINTPASCELIVNQGKLTIVDTDILDSDGKLIAIGGQLSNEIVKRINMHDELVKSLDEMCGVWRLVCNSNGWDENHMSQYENAIKLLERYK